MDPSDPRAFDTMSAIGPLFVAIVVILIVTSIGIGVYRSVRMSRRGQNPVTLQEDLAFQASRSSALAPRATKAERLDELDRLRDVGRITEAELTEARARILAE